MAKLWSHLVKQGSQWVYLTSYRVKLGSQQVNPGSQGVEESSKCVKLGSKLVQIRFKMGANQVLKITWPETKWYSFQKIPMVSRQILHVYHFVSVSDEKKILPETKWYRRLEGASLRKFDQQREPKTQAPSTNQLAAKKRTNQNTTNT